MWSAMNPRSGNCRSGFAGGNHLVNGTPVLGSTISTGRQPRSRRSRFQVGDGVVRVVRVGHLYLLFSFKPRTRRQTAVSPVETRAATAVRPR